MILDALNGHGRMVLGFITDNYCSIFDKVVINNNLSEICN